MQVYRGVKEWENLAISWLKAAMLRSTKYQMSYQNSVLVGFKGVKKHEFTFAFRNVFGSHVATEWRRGGWRRKTREDIAAIQVREGGAELWV